MLELYSKKNCVQCYAVKKWLTASGLEFVEKNALIEENREYLQELGIKSVPALKIGDSFIIGYNLSELEKLLK